MGKLPQELVDEVISSIDRTRPDGHSALLACSRVCRSWQRQAQKELFPHVQFIGIPQLGKWVRNISLESEVSSYVRHLRWAVWPVTMEQPDPLLEKSFPGCFVMFSNIQTLYVSNLSLRYLDTTAIERTFSHLGHSLRSLDIAYLTANLEKWCLLVSLFPNLRRINIPEVTMLEREGEPGPNYPHSFNFTGHITPYCRRTEQFFRCIAGLNLRFESLEVHTLNEVLIDTFNLIMRSCSATLTTISITPLLTLGTEAIRTMLYLDLSPCTNLRALRIDPELASYPEFDVPLRTVSSKHFEKLIFVPGISRNTSQWDQNDEIFRSFAERLYRLGAAEPLTLVLELRAMEEERVKTPDVQHMLPLFCEVGIIVKEYSGLDG